MNNILDLPMNPQDNDASASSVREYLVNLLLCLWAEGEGFSGKRPFGNSGWQHELYVPLVEHGIVTGVLDEDGFIESVDTTKADLVIRDAIASLF